MARQTNVARNERDLRNRRRRRNGGPTPSDRREEGAAPGREGWSGTTPVHCTRRDRNCRAAARKLRLRAHVSEARFGITVWRGTENPSVKSYLLFLEAQRTQSWCEYRSIQLRTLELDPSDYSVMLDLAKRAERSAPLEETDSYYAKALGIRMANVESMKQRRPNDPSEAIHTECGRIRAVRSLLPALYEARGDREIRCEIEYGRVDVRLVDSAGRVLKAGRQDFR